MEIAAQEPTMQSCLKIIQSTCLAQGLDVEVNGQKSKKEFKDHLNRHYLQFCEHAIRAMFVCGFIPWRLRRLATGDPIPEVLPLGTFMWGIHSGTQVSSSYAGGNHNGGGRGRSGGGGGAQRRDPYAVAADRNFKKQREYLATMKPYDLPEDKTTRKQLPSGGSDDKSRKPSRPTVSAAYQRQWRALQRQPLPIDDEETKMLRYMIYFTENCGISEDEVEIYEYIQPNKDVTLRSAMYKTVPSPLAHVLNDYRNLRKAVIRKDFCDAWNTRAKLVCSYQSGENKYGISEGNPITNDWVVPQNRLGLTSDTNLPTEIEQNAYVRDAVMETITSSKHEPHKPVVYTLPKNSRLEQVQHLTPVQDVREMQVKLAKDITSLMGIPYELVGGGYSDKEGKKKAMENTRIFTTNMMNVCKHLEIVMGDVYTATYGGDRSGVKFLLRPTPRIEIGSVEEIVMLIESGVVSAENAMQISNMLLGVDLLQGAGARASAGADRSQMFVTPAQKKDMIVAESALQKAKQTPTTTTFAGKK